MLPSQIGALLPATGAVGGEFTVTNVVFTALVHPSADVAVTEYVPVLEVAALLITEFCESEVKLPGPFQLYVAPVELAVSEISFPTHTGVLLAAVGAAGAGAVAFTGSAGMGLPSLSKSSIFALERKSFTRATTAS